MGASGSAGAETSLALQARLLGDSLCLDAMKAGTPEGLSEPKGHWHITMTFHGPACWGSSQDTVGL